MKTVAITLAALIALSGAVFAGDSREKPTDADAKQKNPGVEMTTTGSIRADKTDEVKKPRLGYDIDPFMPTFN